MISVIAEIYELWSENPIPWTLGIIALLIAIGWISNLKPGVKPEKVYSIDDTRRGWSKKLPSTLNNQDGLYFILFDSGVGKWGKSTNLRQRLRHYDKPDKKKVTCVYYKICEDIDRREDTLLKLAGRRYELALGGREYYTNVDQSDGLDFLTRA
jgi:hypothetical protein